MGNIVSNKIFFSEATSLGHNMKLRSKSITSDDEKVALLVGIMPDSWEGL